jgi:chromate transporter
MQDPPPPIKPTLAEFAVLMIRVGLTSFGGGISGWMLRIVAHQKRWLTEAEFLDGLALCQVFPGINVVNLAIWLGYRLHGGWGALLGALAMVVPPGLVILAMAAGLAHVAHDHLVQAAMDGVAAAAIGLTGSMGWRAARRCTALVPAAIMILTLLAVGVLRLPLFAVMAVLVPLSIGLAWRRSA